MDDARTGIFRRLRAALLGGPAESTAASGVAHGGRRGVGYLTPEPGPFDDPPREPVELDPKQLPWELQEESAAPDPGRD